MSIFFFMQKAAYELRISDWSSDVCSSDLPEFDDFESQDDTRDGRDVSGNIELNTRFGNGGHFRIAGLYVDTNRDEDETSITLGGEDLEFDGIETQHERSEEHTSELQSLMRTSYAVFCLKKKKIKDKHINQENTTR